AILGATTQRLGNKTKPRVASSTLTTANWIPWAAAISATACPTSPRSTHAGSTCSPSTSRVVDHLCGSCLQDRQVAGDHDFPVEHEAGLLEKSCVLPSGTLTPPEEREHERVQHLCPSRAGFLRDHLLYHQQRGPLRSCASDCLENRDCLVV